MVKIRVAAGGNFLCVFGCYTTSELADCIEEHAAIAVGEVCEVVGELGEVVAGAELEIVAEVAIDGDERAGLGVGGGRDAQAAELGGDVPGFEHVDVGAADDQMRVAVEPGATQHVVLQFSDPKGIFGAERQLAVDFVRSVDGEDVALLRVVVAAEDIQALARRRQIVEERVLEQRIEPIVVDGR